MGSEAQSLYVILSANATAYDAIMKSSSRQMKKFGDDVEDTGKKLDEHGNALDRYSSRLGLMTRGLTAALPAVSGLSAAAVPALFATASALGISTTAAGVTAIAFQGLGDTLQALRKAELEPTPEALEEVQRQLRGLSPEAAAAVLQLNDMIPALKEVRDAAAAGVFTGGSFALDKLDESIPRLERFAKVYGDAVGDLLTTGAADLTSGRWSDFVTFLEGEASPTLSSLGATVADLSHGMAELWMAMDPANDDVLGGLERGADVFDRWASGLEGSDKFEAFLGYVRETGPEVVDTALDLAKAVLAIGEAAAPLTGPVLDGIQALAGAVESIASSPAGGMIASYAATASVATLARQGIAAAKASGPGLGVAETISNVKILGTAFRKTADDADELTDAQGKVADSTKKAADSNSTLIASNETAAASEKKVSTETKKTATAQERRTAALRQSAVALGKQAAMLAGVAAVSTGVADKAGLANTATFALTGAMIGGAPGAAAGGLIGAFMDATAVSDSLENQLQSLEATMTSTSATWAERVQQISSATARWQEQADDDSDVTGFFDFFDDAFSANSRSLLGHLTGADDAQTRLRASAIESSKEISQLIVNLDLLSRKIEGGGDALAGRGGLSFFGESDDRSVKAFKENFTEIDGIIQSVAPALQKMGLGLDALGDRNLDTTALADMVMYLDSAEGRADAVGDAIAGLDSRLMNTSQSAQVFGKALSDALQPGIDLSEQTDNWIKSIGTLDGEVAKNSKTLVGNGEAALKNRDAVRLRVEQLQQTVMAQAAAGASSEDLARSLRQQRETLIRAGVAAGMSRTQMRAYLRQLGLTPRLVNTAIKASGIEVVSNRVRALRRAYGTLGRPVQLQIKANGVPKTKADVEALVKQFGLTEKQRTALIKLQAGGAKKGTTDIIKLLDKTDKKTAKPSIKIDASAANATLAAVQSRLDNLRDGYADVYVTEHKRTTKDNADGGLYAYADGGLRTFAGGGYGAGGKYYDRVSQIVSGGANIYWGEQETGWEAYISGKPGRRDRNRQIWMEAGRRLGFDLSPNAGALPAAAAAGGGPVVVQAALPESLELVVDGQRFTAFVRGHAADVSAGQIRTASQSGESSERMNWT